MKYLGIGIGAGLTAIGVGIAIAFAQPTDPVVYAAFLAPVGVAYFMSLFD